MKKRLFLAINIPDEVKSKLEKFNQQFNSNNFRLTIKEDFHTTLLFLGYVEEENISEICKSIERLAASTKPFALEFKSINLAPPKVVKTMVWLFLKESKDYSDLVEKTQSALKHFTNQKARTKRIPHVTLLRSNEKISRLKVLPLKKFSMEVTTLGLYESTPTENGSRYKLIKKFELT